MLKPFAKLAEIYGIKPSQEFIPPEKAPLYQSFKATEWEGLAKVIKPISKEDILPYEPPKIKEVLNLIKKRKKVTQQSWPPKSLQICLPLTSEYIEGKKESVSLETLRKLREGFFSVKAVLNLRGLTAEEALVALEEFFSRAIMLDYSCVLVIHGRGLSSPNGQPVLKPLFQNWLERGPYRRYVLAYTTSRPCDGGLGATYVLLSQRPVKK